ncbi:MAG: DUF3737 family protein [Clostridia bacterium]|nr:DUF3737 family protein [Clostridia bacterium]
MKVIANQTFDAERALYGVDGVTLDNCKFDGPADGESALKEGKNIVAQNCYFNLRYPFWHDHGVVIEGSHMTELCRAALWYSTDISIKNSKLHGIKALRECQNIHVENCDVASVEFGWFCKNITLKDSAFAGEYFLLRSQDVKLNNVTLKGKYSFQYVTDMVIENCNLDTKDAFWHAKNVVVKNSVVKGEYLGWYAENLTFENCTIIGTQPLCYCKGLKLINCKMEGCDLAFERSEVQADIHSHVESIKNVTSGLVSVDSVGEVIVDEPFAQGTVIVRLQN